MFGFWQFDLDFNFICVLELLQCQCFKKCIFDLLFYFIRGQFEVVFFWQQFKIQLLFVFIVIVVYIMGGSEGFYLVEKILVGFFQNGYVFMVQVYVDVLLLVVRALFCFKGDLVYFFDFFDFVLLDFYDFLGGYIVFGGRFYDNFYINEVLFVYICFYFFCYFVQIMGIKYMLCGGCNFFCDFFGLIDGCIYWKGNVCFDFISCYFWYYDDVYVVIIGIGVDYIKECYGGSQCDVLMFQIQFQQGLVLLVNKVGKGFGYLLLFLVEVLFDFEVVVF